MGTKHTWTNADGLTRYGGPRAPEGNNTNAEKAIDKEVTPSVLGVQVPFVPAGTSRSDSDANSTQLQALINLYSETNRATIVFPRSSVLYFSSGITIRAGVVNLDLNGSELNFDAMVSGSAITIRPPIDPYVELANTNDLMVNGYIRGPSADSTVVDGIFIDRVTAGTGVITGMSLRNIVVKGFRDGIFYDRGAYINHLYNCSIIGARRRGINYPGSEYAGENLSMFGGRISDCTNAGRTAVGVYMGTGGNNQLHLFGTSIDYNDIQGHILSGRVKVFGGNVENNYSGAPQWIVDATGAGDFAELYLACDTSLTELAPGRAAYITVAGDRAFIDISQAYVYAFQMTTEIVQVVSGNPHVVYEGVKLLATGGSGQQPKICNYYNMVYQGQDASTPVTAPWVAASGNVAVSVGTGQGVSGANSIRGIWNGVASSSVYYEIPVTPGRIFLMEAQIKVTALASGSVFLRIRFVDSLGNLIQNNDQVSWNTVGTFNKTSSWYRAPLGASRVRIDIWNGTNTATVDIDDVRAWVY